MSQLNQEEIIKKAIGRDELPNPTEPEERALYWEIRCIVSEFQQGKLTKEQSVDMRRKALAKFEQDDKVAFFRRSQLAEMADSWIKIESLVEAYRKHKSTALADKIIAALYNTEE